MLIFEEWCDIIDDGFDVVDRLVQLPHPMVHTGLILQCANNKSSFNGLATRGCILEYIFSFGEVDDGKGVVLLVDVGEAKMVEFI